MQVVLIPITLAICFALRFLMCILSVSKVLCVYWMYVVFSLIIPEIVPSCIFLLSISGDSPFFFFMGPMFDQLPYGMQASPPVAPEKAHLLDNPSDTSLGLNTPALYGSHMPNASSPHQLTPVVEVSHNLQNQNSNPALLSIIASSAEDPVAAFNS